MSGNNHQVLRLVVARDKVVWELHECELEGGKRDRLDGSGLVGVALERQDGGGQQTIRLLIQMQELLADIRRSGKWDKARIESSELAVVKVLGESLYRYLFRGELVDKLRKALDDTVDGMLRVELEFDDDDAEKEYASWPWEYLRIPRKAGDGEFLALKAQLVLNRHLSPKGDLTALKSLGRPRVLLVVAGPPGKSIGDYGVVQAEKVVTTLRELHEARAIELVDLVEPEFEIRQDWAPTASWTRFKKAIEESRPDVVHFIGHGRRRYDATEEFSELVFIGAGCAPDEVRDTEFVDAVAKQRSNLRLVFLQACESGVRGGTYASATSVGQLLADRGIPAVVAMQAKVENFVANDFAVAFYMALRESNPVDVAVRAGREAIKNLSEGMKLAFGVPVLYLRNYEALIGRAPTDGGAPGRLRSSVPTRPGPAGEAPLVCEKKSSGRFCANCGLCLNCPKCGEALEFALVAPCRMKPFCGACGHKVEQGPAAPQGPEQAGMTRSR